MNRRNKVGGILDRRFGENDPTLAPEDKMLERFAQEKQRSHKKASMFDLEDDANIGGLTHLGQSLSFDDSAMIDDFDEEDVGAESGEDGSDDERRALKRMRPHDAEDGESDRADGEPERKKTKQEVMKELIAKSKYYKYERQQAKDADEDLREELDKEFRELHPLLFNRKSDAATATIDTVEESAAAQKEKLERQYDMRLRQLALDRRAQPTDRTKTEEEQAEEEASRLKELELKRIRRMEGQQDSDSEDEQDDDQEKGEETNHDDQFTENEEEDFGLGTGIKTKPTAAELGFDDEDDFLIEDDLIASGSDLEPVESDDESGEAESDAEDDDEFTKGLLNDEETNNPIFSGKLNGSTQAVETQNDADGLPYTFPCPETLEELVQVATTVPIEKVPTVVQRIRALYHPKLDSDNKAKLGNFAKSLVQYIAYVSNLPQIPPFSVLENLIRHIHSLAKSYPIEISNAFRTETEELRQSRRLSPNLGDLMILTAIGTIFPTS